MEGLLLAAQKEFQEKKVIYFGNLYANIAFDASIDRFQANYLIRLIEKLSYRQLCLLAETQDCSFTWDQEYKKNDLVNELNELVTFGLMKREISGKIATYENNAYGKKIFELFGLNEMDVNERTVLFRKQ